MARILAEIVFEAFAIALFVMTGTVWLLVFSPGF